MIRAERVAVLPVPRESLWQFIAETDSLNRRIGLPPVHFTYSARPEGGTAVRGRARIAGQVFTYDEEPYCWVKPREWSVRRVVDRGPLLWLQPRVLLESLDSGATRVTTSLSCEPRSGIHRALARHVANVSAGSLMKQCRAFAKSAPDSNILPNSLVMPSLDGDSVISSERFEQARERLLREGIDPDSVALISRLVREAPSESLIHIRPYRLADHWRVERRELLRVFLHAARAGLFDVRWRILCPACQGAGNSVETLSALPGEPHCASCNIRFDPNFDQNVEVCFRVAPRIRNSANSEATFCVGGPELSPHVAIQQYLRPGELVEFEAPAEEGDYRLWSPQSAHSEWLRVSNISDSGRLPIEIVPADARCAFSLSQHESAPGGLWSLHNKTKMPLLARIVHAGWRTHAATAAEVSTMQAFRDLFSSEVLSANTEMSVQQVAILFSDLKGSTALYAERGDAPSYAVVRDHFAFLREIIDTHEGAIVKTIGDAVMAAFSDASHALKAAIAIQRAAPSARVPTVVKLGLHSGPALAVNANGTLDYFGRVVNTAARIQHESVGADIVIAQSLVDADRTLMACLADVQVEPFTADLRGVSAQVPLLRIRV